MVRLVRHEVTPVAASTYIRRAESSATSHGGTSAAASVMNHPALTSRDSVAASVGA